jgi:hypothetical protein
MATGYECQRCRQAPCVCKAVQQETLEMILKERLANLETTLEKYVQAVGLASTLVPDMEIDSENPIGMMKKLEAFVNKLKKGQRKLRALEAAGVDNWEGYAEATRSLYEEEDDG